MPVIVELRNRVKRDQQNLLAQAKRIQEIIAENQNDVEAIRQALSQSKGGIRTMLNFLNTSLDNDLKQANEKEQSNYTDLSNEFRAKRRVYSTFLEDEIGQISLILKIFGKKTITNNDIALLLSSASRLVTLCETMIGTLGSLKVRY